MEQICAYLSEQKGWTHEQIQETLQNWRNTQNQLLSDMAGIQVRVDTEGYLIWETFPEFEVLERIKLLSDAPVGHTGPRTLIWIDPESGKQLDMQTLPADSGCGLVVSGKKVFLHSKSLEAFPLLAQTNVWVDTAFPDTRPHHLDLQILPERNLLFVLHREAGVVHIYHLELREKLASWQIRAPGHSLAINLSFDRSGLKAYLTDNVTPQLWIADLASLELKLWKSGLGVLGNILAAPEPGCLYLTILKPHFNLIYFELDSMAARYSVEIRGEPLTGKRLLAWDPFMADKHSDLLFYLAGREQSGQTLPVLNIIDANEVRTIKRSIVRSNNLPVLLVSGSPNPFVRFQELDFQTWLVEQGLVQPDELITASLTTNHVRPRPGSQEFQVYQPPADDPSVWQQLDQPAVFCELPVLAEDVIVDLICWAFYRLTLTNLRIHTGEIQNIKKAAHRLRLDLQTKQALLAKMTGILGRYDFQTPVSRTVVLNLLSQLEQGNLVRIEDLCPLCQAKLEGDLCLDCGFQLNLPDSERLNLMQSSAEPATQLLPGQLFLPHPQQAMLVTLNLWQQPLSGLIPEGVKMLNYALVLPNQHLLAVDTLGNKLLEFSPAGEIVWKAKLSLKQPVMCTYYQTHDGDLRYLVVDHGNGRVLELDRLGKHHRRYPTLKTEPGNKLVAPTDVQLTPSGTWLISDSAAQRVLEVDSRGGLVSSFGPEQGLEQPLAARRKADESTEIYDASRGSILIFDAKGILQKHFDIWPPIPQTGSAENPVPGWSDSPAPHFACLIHNGEWLLLGQNYMMLVAPLQQKLRWISHLPDFSQEQGLLKVRFSARTGADLRKKQLDENVLSLRQIELFTREPDEHLAILSKHVQTLSFDAQDWLLSPDELGNAIFFVLEGVLDIVAPQKDLAVIFQIRPGESCGTQSVLSLGDISWRPGIRVQSNCRLLMLERGEFKKAVVGFPRLFSLVRHLDHEHQRRFKQFREQKTIQAQDKLRIRLNEAQIQKFSIFDGAEPDFIEALAGTVQAIAYLPDQIICHRGESGGSVFFILEGSVGIERRGEFGAALALSEGDIFGEMSIILESPRSATVKTLDYCKFFVLEEPALRGLGARFPWLWQRLETLAQQRQQANSIDWASFAKQSGIDRQDMPLLQMPYGSRIDEEMFYLPSLHHDAVIGLTQQGEVLWFWGRDPARQLFQPTRVQTLENTLLVTDTGNDRILEIGLFRRDTLRIWKGSLKQPSAAAMTPEGLLLVADTGNQRLVVMDESGREVWQYGLPEEIMQPVNVEITNAGTLLFADAGMHKVYELSLSGQVLWSYGKWRNPGIAPDQLCEPSWTHRLKDGSTLIADAGNQRLVWLEVQKPPLITPLNQLGAFKPHHCQQLRDGDWLLIDPFQDRAVRLNKRGEIIWEVHIQYPDLSTHIHNVVSDELQEAVWVIDESILDTPLDTTDTLLAQPGPEAESFVLEKTPLLDESQALGLTESVDSVTAYENHNYFWRELGLEVPSTKVGLDPSIDHEMPELMPELDQLLEQVAENLETFTEQDAWNAFAFIESHAGADTGTTLILRAESETIQTGLESDEPEAGDKVDDFLDFLMSGQVEPDQSS